MPTQSQLDRRTLLKGLACASLSAALTITSAGQKPAPASAAPIPPGIASAKTVFLSNVCELPYKSCAPVYNELYAGISKQGKYQLVSSPAEADLIFEIHFNTRLVGVSGPKGFPSGDTEGFLQLKIVDRATQVPLWAITETTDQASATNAVLLDLSVLSKPGEKAGPEVNFPPKKK